MTALIVAKSKTNNIIGINNTLPWKQKNDMQRFKSLTVHKKVVMGRTTFESLGSKPLPNRQNIILTTNDELLKNRHDIKLSDHYFTSKDKVINMFEFYDDIVIIGGTQIYAEFMNNYVDVMYVTDIHAPEDLAGDAFFPEIDLDKWKVYAKESYKADENNQYDYDFLTYIRK